MSDRRAYIDGMDAGTSAPAGADTGLVGRREESSRLTGLVTPPFAESQVLLILGDPGIGKTVLLASAVREARVAGMRVLTAAGRESEQDLAFAGLHQLLRPVLDHVASLPARQAGALRGAFAISDDPVPPDALLTGIGVLTLLSGLGPRSHRRRRQAADHARGVPQRVLHLLAIQSQGRAGSIRAHVLPDRGPGRRHHLGGAPGAVRRGLHLGIPGHAELQRLAGITHPVFVANGDSDPMIPPRYSHLIAGLLPNASVKIYPDAAHGFLWQHHAEFAADVTEFLG